MTTLPSTVRIGGVEKVELLRALREHGIRLNHAAEALFQDGRFALSKQARLVQITTRSVADLGFGDGASYAQLVARALESRLAECPLELAPHLRMQLIDQLDATGEPPAVRGGAPAGSITVASSPLDDADETPKGFYLRRVDGVSWLRGYWSWAGHVWSPEDVFVFSLTA
jgi:hypothetical protein